MRIRTLESDFEYQAKEILIRALKGFEAKNLDDVDKFQNEIWRDGLAKEIGRKFIEKLGEYNGEETFEEVMYELKEK